MDRTREYSQCEDGTGLNYWSWDPVFQSEARRVYGRSDFAWAKPRLEQFGRLIGTTVAPNADRLDQNPPTLKPFDRNGNLVNEVVYHPAQLENERRVYEQGIVSDVFRPPSGRDQPLPIYHNLSLQYLLCYADVGLACPVAMTTGVARVIEAFDRGGAFEDTFERLIASNYERLHQGAMFLTEKQGGSDVGTTRTRAEKDGDRWRLRGEKWFCSNLDAEVMLVLAREPDAPQGTEGLSLFVLPRHREDGELNEFRFRRLKDKLGTRSVPTGEVELNGAKARRLGEARRGFRYMAEMLNLERLSNAFAACGVMGRALLESKIHAASRETFGRRLREHPLMKRDLVDLAVTHEAATAFSFDAGAAYSRYRQNDQDTAYKLARVLTPLAKYRTGRMVVDVTSYAMEILGGNGYVRDFVTHRLLRDAQVLPIWEGTSNILCLDVLRAIERHQAHQPYFELIENRLEEIQGAPYGGMKDQLREALNRVRETVHELLEQPNETAQYRAKALSDALFDVYTGTLLLWEAHRDHGDTDPVRKTAVARHFIDPPALKSTPLSDETTRALLNFAPLDAG